MKIGSRTTKTRSARYYRLDIVLMPNQKKHSIIQSNSERASIIAALQDTLGDPLHLDDLLIKRLSIHTDLLGFSIKREAVSFVLFSLTHADAQNFGAHIVNRLSHFQQTHHVYSPEVALPRARIVELAGPHDALHTITQLHLRHEDWEYDRYSSIGFYLHERRGSWMRLWRIAPLFNSDPDTYRQLLRAAQTRSYTLEDTTLVT